MLSEFGAIYKHLNVNRKFFAKIQRTISFETPTYPSSGERLSVFRGFFFFSRLVIWRWKILATWCMKMLKISCTKCYISAWIIREEFPQKATSNTWIKSGYCLTTHFKNCATGKMKIVYGRRRALWRKEKVWDKNVFKILIYLVQLSTYDKK